MTEPGHIVAFGGVGPGYGDRALDDFVLSLARRLPARVCFVPTASGDDVGAVARFYRAFAGSGHVTTDLALFDRTVADLRSFLLEQDVILVKGGNTANLLAIWRAHGVGSILREALAEGVVLCGESAGMNCWFETCMSDSFGNGIEPFRDGLGFIEGSACSHYDSPRFPERRPAYLHAVEAGLPAGYAAGDAVGLHFHRGQLVEAITSVPDGSAYRVALVDDRAQEERLPTRFLPGPTA